MPLKQYQQFYNSRLTKKAAEIFGSLFCFNDSGKLSKQLRGFLYLDNQNLTKFLN